MAKKVLTGLQILLIFIAPFQLILIVKMESQGREIRERSDEMLLRYNRVENILDQAKQLRDQAKQLRDEAKRILLLCDPDPKVKLDGVDGESVCGHKNWCTVQTR